MKNALALFLSVVCASAFADSYRAKGFDVIGCADKKIALELTDAMAHPGAMSDERFGDLVDRGGCSPLSPNVGLRILRVESVKVAAGEFPVALVAIKAPASAEAAALRFYVVKSLLEPY